MNMNRPESPAKLARTKSIAILTAAALLLVAQASKADICLALTHTQAVIAKSIIDGQFAARGGDQMAGRTTLIQKCDLCQDKSETSIVVKQIEIQVNSVDNENVVAIDDSGTKHLLDLAYTFINLGKSSSPVRLAPMAGCFTNLDQ
jgi:hypothetical protein